MLFLQSLRVQSEQSENIQRVAAWSQRNRKTHRPELCYLAVSVEQKIDNNLVMPLEKELRNNEAESPSRSIAQAHID